MTDHREELTDEIVGKAHAAVIVSTWRHDGHPDHEAVGEAAATAAGVAGARHWEYPIWASHRGLIDPTHLARAREVRTSRTTRAAKLTAARMFLSQLEPSPDGRPVVPRELVDRLGTGPEIMLRMTQVPADAFEAQYRLDDDPWNFATSEYEQRRFDITMACLPPGRFRRGFEPPCAGGELTVKLSTRCDELVACDGSPTVAATGTTANRRVGGPRLPRRRGRRRRARMVAERRLRPHRAERDRLLLRSDAASGR